MTFDNNGHPKKKYRVNHDLSSPLNKKVAINNRVIKEDMPQLYYGHVLRRTVHHIHKLRQRHPLQRILINKRDLKDAYRRLHTWAHTAAACMVMIGHLIHILPQLPFGAAPSPSEFCVSSKMTIDLAMDILDSEWDPATNPTPNRNLIPPPKRFPIPSHYPTALPLVVDIPYRPHKSTGCRPGQS